VPGVYTAACRVAAVMKDADLRPAPAETADRQVSYQAVLQDARRSGAIFGSKTSTGSARSLNSWAGHELRRLGHADLVPLLVVVAAASAATHHGLAVWVVYGMGLTGSSAAR